MAKTIPNKLIRYLWVEALANKAAPSAAELTAAGVVDLVGENDLETFTGLTTAGSTTETPSLGSNVTTKAPSVVTLGDPEATWWFDDETSSTAAAIFSALALYERGNIVRVFPVAGAKPALVAGTVVEVWPATVVKPPERNDPVSGEAIRFSAMFAVDEPPAIDVAVVA